MPTITWTEYVQCDWEEWWEEGEEWYEKNHGEIESDTWLGLLDKLNAFMADKLGNWFRRHNKPCDLYERLELMVNDKLSDFAIGDERFFGWQPFVAAICRKCDDSNYTFELDEKRG